jgi:hypothetical protein
MIVCTAYHTVCRKAPQAAVIVGSTAVTSRTAAQRPSCNCVATKAPQAAQNQPTEQALSSPPTNCHSNFKGGQCHSCWLTCNKHSQSMAEQAPGRTQP